MLPPECISNEHGHDKPKTYLILGGVGVLATEAVELSARPPTNKTVSLQRLIILDVLLELAQWIARC